MAKFDPERDLPPELITAVGLLTIYATQADTGLVAILAAATQTKIAQADAMLHSTGSAKARADLVRAAVGSCDIPDAGKAASYDLLDRLVDLNAKRNEWIHGFWHLSDKPNTYQVTLYWPNRKTQEKIKPLDANTTAQVRAICDGYLKVTQELCLLSTRLANPPAPSA